MGFESVLRTNLLPETLTEDQRRVRIYVEKVFGSFVDRAVQERTKTPGSAKDIVDVMELIRDAIKDYEARAHTSLDGQIDVVYENPDKPIEVETISMSVVSRLPGTYSQGAPGEGTVRNRRPILREITEDPDNPGYKRVVLGFFYDNILRLTCWAKTNKAANQRAVWLEDRMEEYDWFFVYNGCNRLLYDGWRANEKIDIGNNRYFGRPIDFFVRTEKLINISEKTLEQIVIRLGVMTA